ncbi:MAG: FtsQ-type POTRA domain-containing protein [Proteobacteria bacterium]|nr:FtsQ-type POTRA domain-containing protein [Pseudomonadota bacterium]
MFTKILYYLLSLLGLSASAALATRYIYPAQFEQFWWETRLVAREAWSGKDLSFSGISRLQTEDLEVRIPIERSNIWWWLNTSAVEAALMSHPLVVRAEVRHCERLSIRCFRIAITERSPRYVLNLSGQRWLVGADGGFMTTLKDDESLPGMVVISGLSNGSDSPDIVSARFAQLRGALDIIEQHAQVAVSTVDFRSNLEFLVRFEAVPFPVLFDMSSDGEFIPVEARRLKRLLQEFEGRLDEIRQIDLAYNKQAVVRRVWEPEPKTSSVRARER